MEPGYIRFVEVKVRAMDSGHGSLVEKLLSISIQKLQVQSPAKVKRIR